MDNIIIKEIKDVDWKLINTIRKLEKRNLGKQASINEWVIPVIIRYGRFIAAMEEKSSNIVGVCELIRSWEDKRTAFIHSFYVDRRYRKKGVGRRLLGEVIDILRVDGFKKVELTVDSKNKASICLYKNFGFARINFRKDEYGRGIDRELMRLEL